MFGSLPTCGLVGSYSAEGYQRRALEALLLSIPEFFVPVLDTPERFDIGQPTRFLVEARRSRSAQPLQDQLTADQMQRGFRPRQRVALGFQPHHVVSDLQELRAQFRLGEVLIKRPLASPERQRKEYPNVSAVRKPMYRSPGVGYPTRARRAKKEILD